MSDITALLVLPSFVLLIVDIVALILVIIGVRGRGRLLAAVGVVLQMASFLASTFFSLMLNQVVHNLQLAAAEVQLLSVIVNLVTSLIVALGLVMIGLAIAPRSGRSAGPGQPTGFGPATGVRP